MQNACILHPVGRFFFQREYNYKRSIRLIKIDLYWSLKRIQNKVNNILSCFDIAKKNELMQTAFTIISRRMFHMYSYIKYNKYYIVYASIVNKRLKINNVN